MDKKYCDICGKEIKGMDKPHFLSIDHIDQYDKRTFSMKEKETCVFCINKIKKFIQDITS